MKGSTNMNMPKEGKAAEKASNAGSSAMSKGSCDLSMPKGGGSAMKGGK